MMVHSFWRQMARTLLRSVFLILWVTLSSTADVPDVKDDHSPVLHRQKRDWNFNIFFATEELQAQDLPQVIGTLVNSHSNENTEFVIFGEGANDIFKVNKTGQVSVCKTLDRETKDSYKLTARIRDINSKTQLDKDTQFSVKVQDVNDHAPIFEGELKASINERSPRGTAVMTVRATDKDDPTSPNGRIEYKLLDTDYFFIDKKTGQISVATDQLDRETRSQYTVTVQASDMPYVSGGRTTTTEVTVNINDINDNVATFKEGTWQFNVNENESPLFTVGKLSVYDPDEKQNKNPIFTLKDHSEIFSVELDDENNGVLKLRQGLDFETKPSYTFLVEVREEGVVQPADNVVGSRTSAQVQISVKDVDEPPVFTESEYSFNVSEGEMKDYIGFVSAKDPDTTKHRVRFSIVNQDCPAEINSETGRLSLKRKLDREEMDTHQCQVTAQEMSVNGLKSFAAVKINVRDVNDNPPELDTGREVYVCENDKNGTVVGIIGAKDKDVTSQNFRFTLVKKSTNFSLHDNLNNTASIVLTHGGYSTDVRNEVSLEVQISDGGRPLLTKIQTVTIKVCSCQKDRQQEFCQAIAQTGVSFRALISILLCIVTMLVIVILFALRKHYQKETLVALGKSSGEIHEQLVTYDEEGGGEMDTNGYDVSILSSACLRPAPGPPVYAVAKKPSACKGDMAMMIEVKKDEADHDRDGIPYDTLHIYGYEGTESLAGSLSSLDSSSIGSNVDYDFLSDWGPRFRTLAQLYGADVSDSDSSY
ncbi:cadherin-5 [Hoplias malabaricus]|uniref:cadherin-5 n=1 Tax=Hoplias malabaricus TaxID=27720 RepID=UPI0034623351